MELSKKNILAGVQLTILRESLSCLTWLFVVAPFSCFLSLLIIAAVLYKIKHKYDNYRRRQVGHLYTDVNRQFWVQTVHNNPEWWWFLLAVSVLSDNLVGL